MGFSQLHNTDVTSMEAGVLNNILCYSRGTMAVAMRNKVEWDRDLDMYDSMRFLQLHNTGVTLPMAGSDRIITEHYSVFIYLANQCQY